MRSTSNVALPFLLLALGLAPSPALAHDFWIEPTRFRADPNAVIGVGLRVGDEWKGEPVERVDKRIVKFIIVGPGGPRPIPGADGRDPAGLVRLEQPGLYLLAYQSHHALVELDASKFEAYLKEEGLEKVIEQRKQSGDADKPVREKYARCAKALVLCGPDAGDGADTVLGLPLELVPDANPYAMTDGRQLSVRLLFRGKPLSGALVQALPRAAPGEALRARTDSDGRVKLMLPRAGPWLINAVHMVPGTKELDADWESLWASLTFDLPALKK